MASSLLSKRCACLGVVSLMLDVLEVGMSSPLKSMAVPIGGRSKLAGVSHPRRIRRPAVISSVQKAVPPPAKLSGGVRGTSTLMECLSRCGVDCSAVSLAGRRPARDVR